MTEEQLRDAMTCDHASAVVYQPAYSDVLRCVRCGIEVTKEESRICGGPAKAAAVVARRKLLEIESMKQEAASL